ncbi:MAG: hypothetical protein PVG32_11515 [Anaerolineales bacterium]
MKNKNIQDVLVFILLIILTSGCTALIPEEKDPSQTLPPQDVTTKTITAENIQQSTSQPDDDPVGTVSNPLTYIGYTQLQADGNRVVQGFGYLPSANILDIPLSGEPGWVVAVPSNNGSVWLVTLDDGRVEGFLLNNGEYKPILISSDDLPPGKPPLLLNINGTPELLSIPNYSQSLITHPILIPKLGRKVFINTDGDLIILDKNENNPITLAINALPDTRILSDAEGRLLILSDPTTSYDHGVLGDAIEATSISLIETIPTIDDVIKIGIPENKVIEGISPIWTDVNNDNIKEIIVTLSDRKEGAQIAVISETRKIIAFGPAIGRGYRWRHQIAVAPFGPDNELELVDVLTPHIGGVVEFYRLIDDKLVIVAQIEGFTSHVIGSRNLDMAAAGDFDGDGRVELLLPNQALNSLGAIQRNSTGAEIDWILPLDGNISTNLAATTLSDGQILVGIGRSDGILRIWYP